MLSEHNYHTQAMGCDFELTFVTASTQEADVYFVQSLRTVQIYEKLFSRFDTTSQIAQLNQHKIIQPSSLFLEVFHEAASLYKKTNRLFNPLVRVSEIGYNVPFEQMNRDERNTSRQAVNYGIDFDDIVFREGLLRLNTNQELDFGGFLKGYVVQRIAASFAHLHGAIINLGGDLYVSGLDAKGNIFEITIHNPIDEEKSISLPITNYALCTSGTYKRKWITNKKQKHHIIDPKTRDSVDSDIVSASVLHIDGACADAYATAAIALGVDKAMAFFQEKKISFVIIANNGIIHMSQDIIPLAK